MMSSQVVFPSVLGLAALIVLGPAQAEPPKAPKGAAGWARVESLQPGKATRLVLFKDRAAPGARKIKGVFSSATDSSVTIMLKDGRTRTIERQAIRAVRVSRRARRRYGWIPGAAVFVAWLGYTLSEGDFTPGGRLLLSTVYSAPAWFLGYLLTPSTRSVYRAP